jgi:hypothetical protein
MQKFFTYGFLTTLLLASSIAGAQSQYPAADFQPVIIFQDADLIAKHSQAAQERARNEKAKSQTTEAVKRSSSAVAPESAGEAKPMPGGAPSEGSWMDNYPVVLITLALIGFAFWPGKQPGSEVQEIKQAFTSLSGETTAETGGARYLKNLPEKSSFVETKVSKYLKSLPPSAKHAETGVARYLKNLDRSS